MELKGQRALVTGASSGIGVALARQLASRGANLVITARREDRLEALAEELREQHEVDVAVIALDLGDPTAPAQLWDATEGQDRPVDILINNAGFGTQRLFVDIPWELSLQQLQVNLISLTELAHRFLCSMKERGAGYVLNVSSIGAYLPCPQFATYAAGKAYVRNFTEALAYELKGTGVHACCLCPGGTATEFSEVAGQSLPKVAEMTMMSAERCARIGLAALFRGRRNIVSGFANSLGMWLLRFVPRRLAAWIAAKVLT
ncbi:MAG: SDR family oxidoreductase [Deltaproteobacteria bacterium]|nr:SDR family oxidoreductase [Deltaproteobacteria bacterium]